MARFAFEAVDRTGAVVRGHVESRSQNGAVEFLLSTGQTPLLVTESGTGALAALKSPFSLGSGDLLSIVRELASLLRAGLPVERALVVMQELTSSRRTAQKLAQLTERVRAGEPLSRAFATLLSAKTAHLEHLLAAGEASGHLAATMSRLAANLARTKSLRDRLLSALTYPAFLVVTLVGVLWVVFTSVLPRLAPLFSQAGSALPLPTLVLLRISQLLSNHGLLIAIVTAAIVAFIVVQLRREAVRHAIDHRLISSRLFLGIPAEYEAALFCRNLETLLAGGLPLDRALSAARSASSNRWFRERMKAVQVAVEEGATLKTALARTERMPRIVVEFAAVGEETGKLSSLMGECAAVLEQGVETRLERLLALVLPAATLVMGALVAGIMASIVTGLLAVNSLAL